MSRRLTRRRFLAATAAAGVGLALPAARAAAPKKPALLGGKPAKKGGFPGWPVIDEREEKALLDVLRGGKWFRGYGQNVNRLEKAYAYHNNSRGGKISGYNFTYTGRGCNLRMTEFQASLLLAQMTRVEEQSRVREENAKVLTRMLGEIPGILPEKMYEGCTRNAYHLYMFRYTKEAFAGMTRSTFLKALGAEGVPASQGYSPLNKEAFLKGTFATRSYGAIYGKDLLMKWEERTRCPENDRLCEEAVWFTQTMLLGPRSDMEEIAEAVRKIEAHAGELAKA